MTEMRITWICAGCPREHNNVFYINYKSAEKLSRRVHRQVVDSYLNKVHEKTLINLQKLILFWREINKRRHKSNSDADLKINFGGINVREPQLIAIEWGKYFNSCSEYRLRYRFRN